MAYRRKADDSGEQLDLFAPSSHVRTDSIRSNGRETLEGVPAQNGPGIGIPGPTAPNASGGRGKDEGRDGRSPQPIDSAGADSRDGPPAGVGDGSGAVPFAPPGELIRSETWDVSGGIRLEAPARNLRCYRIGPEDDVGGGGLKQKFLQNVQAIELIRRLDGEGRPATQPERSVLVNYSGWGALPQVFDDFNETWAEERAQLRALLSPEELDRARSTTLNAHYTAPVVVSAMYSALERFGFQGGRI